MTAGEQAVTDALALEDLARVARHLRAIDAAGRPARRRRRPTPAPAGVEGHDGHVWWAAGPDVEAVALGLEAKAARPADSVAPVAPVGPLRSGPDLGPVRVVIVDPDERKLRLARLVVATGEPWRGGDDVWFVPGGTGRTGAGRCRTAGCGRLAFLRPAAGPALAGPAAYELLALARWLGLEAPGPLLVDATLRRLGAVPDVVATPTRAGWDAATGGRPGPGADAGPDADPGAGAAGGVGGVAQALHAAGVRVFVDLGYGHAHGDLARSVARALDGRDHVTITALAPGARPLARLDRALAALWVEGVAVLPDALHRPLPADPGTTRPGRGPDPTTVATTPSRHQGDS
jgi:hypothetical protein